MYTDGRHGEVAVVSTTNTNGNDDDDEDDDDVQVDHIRLFFGGGDGNVGTAVIRVESRATPDPPRPNTTVPVIQVSPSVNQPVVCQPAYIERSLFVCLFVCCVHVRRRVGRLALCLIDS